MMEPSGVLPAAIDGDRCRPTAAVDGSWKAPRPPAFRSAWLPADPARQKASAM
ncbi:hypothetical protein EBBID32_8780 [Sphingobium indicum BiD32]|uniref:Uncharacterized protein n=1 Tax=Sphingobium indicum BiD32 TaxID=1301087 RepID=N1MLQ0_9SPHN|nr:hypothetical protein EBBID32_8780 [Sphingobium indicum BiD32]